MTDKENAVLGLLGCVPTLLNIQMELAQECHGITGFQVVQNVAPEEERVSRLFKALPDWQVDFIDFAKEAGKVTGNGPYAFGVVGPESKETVYHYFSKHLGVEENQFLNMIHPTAYVSPSVALNHGLQMEPLSSIAAVTSLGFGVNIKRNATVGHHCIVGNYVTVNPGVVISGEVQIGEKTMIGSGTIVKDQIKIGKNSVIGAGSVVVKDIPDNVVAFGNPCKVVRSNLSE